MRSVRRMPTWLLVGLATVCLGLFGLWQTRDGLALALDADLAAATGGTTSCTKAELDGEQCKSANSQCVGSTYYLYTNQVKLTTQAGSPKAKFTYFSGYCADVYACSSGCPGGPFGGGCTRTGDSGAMNRFDSVVACD